MEKVIRGKMSGIGALEVSTSIKGVFLADENLELETVGKMEKKRVVVILESDYDKTPQDATSAPARLDTLKTMQEYLATEIAREMASAAPVKVKIVPLDTLPLNMEPEKCCDTCKHNGEEGCTLDAVCEDYALWEAK